MIIDKFHCWYNATFAIKNRVFNSLKVPAILRLVILSIANVVIPMVISTQTKNPNFSLKNNNKVRADFVVSLTSFPNRIGKIHLVIESILRQSYRPSQVILWLSKEQFASIDELPIKLLKLRSRGLTIKLTEGDLRSYKKYYFLLEQNPKAAFIIVDDDVFYKSTLLSELIDVHKQYPNAIVANRCAIINGDQQYTNWRGLRGAATNPRFDLLPTGCGGVLYPSGSLSSEAVDSNLFTEVCGDADDIWLSCCAFLNNTPTVYTGHNDYILGVHSSQNIHLHTKNVGQSNNDIRIAAVREYFQVNRGVDVFKRTKC
ncbi:MAG: hypothetical protein ABJJ44_13405 [Paraglaciecola sp.]|uniref:hypothetical protein n=1 Tax=Paraglaciecola sp. TaxID=1920173 RepID=UPI003298EE9B